MSDEDSGSAMPPALINKLMRERNISTSAISTGDLRNATSATKEYTQRKLLALSPKILTRLEDLMDGSNAAVAMTAASKLADLSPAIRIDPLASQALGSDSLPAAAIEALMSGLRPFIEALSDRTATAVAEPVIAPKRKKASHVGK